MKLRKMLLLVGGFSAVLLQGCVAFPPLIQVEHKDTPNNNNQEIVKRLDAIDNRLNQLEKEKAEQKTEQK